MYLFWLCAPLPPCFARFVLSTTAYCTDAHRRPLSFAARDAEGVQQAASRTHGAGCATPLAIAAARSFSISVANGALITRGVAAGCTFCRATRGFSIGFAALRAGI